MSRYIDADELIEFFDGYPDHIEFDVEDIKSIIKEQDTADVVEVVRCKDCKYHAEFSSKCNKLNLTPMWPNDYCSYGERADK